MKYLFHVDIASFLPVPSRAELNSRLIVFTVQLGVLFMQLFFAVTGAQGSLAVVLGTAPSLLVFSIVQVSRKPRSAGRSGKERRCGARGNESRRYYPALSSSLNRVEAVAQ